MVPEVIHMKMKEVILQTGLPEKTIRFYESRGLVHPATDRRNGRTYHEFSSEDVAALKAVVTLRKAQFSIEEIRAMQTSPEKIPEISAGLRRRIQEESDAMTRLLSAEDVFSAPDYLALSRQVERAFQSQTDYISPFRFGAEDPETPEEKAAAIAAYQKRHSRRLWIPVIVALSVLCAALAIGLGYMVHREATAIPAPSGSTEGWIYYAIGGNKLFRCREDGSGVETLYTSDMGGDIQNSNIAVAEDKVYFIDSQRLFSMNADGSGLYRFKPRYYSSYSNMYGLPQLAGDNLYAIEVSSGQFGGGSSCLVKISLQDGKTKQIDDRGTPLAAEGDILYLLRQTVEEYDEEDADETVYTYDLVVYDTTEDKEKVLNEKPLEGWTNGGFAIPNGDTLLFVRNDSMTQDTLLKLNTDTLEFEEFAVVPGNVQDVSGRYCWYYGDFEGDEHGGTYHAWYVENLDTGASVRYPSSSMDNVFVGFAENGFLYREYGDGEGVIRLVPYP